MTPVGHAAAADLPAILTELAAAHGEEVGALAGLVLQHRAAAETVVARSLVDASREHRLPPPGPERRVHVLRIALQRTLEMERRSEAVDPHSTVATAELLAQAVARATGIHDQHRIPAPSLLAAMAALPPRLRALVVLHDLLDLDAHELATVAGGGAGRVGRQLVEAEDRLRASLESPGALGAIEEIGDDV